MTDARRSVDDDNAADARVVIALLLAAFALGLAIGFAAGFQVGG